LRGGLTLGKSEIGAGRRDRRVGWQQKNQREMPDVGAGGLADNRKISHVKGVDTAAAILLSFRFSRTYQGVYNNNHLLDAVE